MITDKPPMAMHYSVQQDMHFHFQKEIPEKTLNQIKLYEDQIVQTAFKDNRLWSQIKTPPQSNDVSYLTHDEKTYLKHITELFCKSVPDQMLHIYSKNQVSRGAEAYFLPKITQCVKDIGIYSQDYLSNLCDEVPQTVNKTPNTQPIAKVKKEIPEKVLQEISTYQEKIRKNAIQDVRFWTNVIHTSTSPDISHLTIREKAYLRFMTTALSLSLPCDYPQDKVVRGAEAYFLSSVTEQTEVVNTLSLDYLSNIALDFAEQDEKKLRVDPLSEHRLRVELLLGLDLYTKKDCELLLNLLAESSIDLDFSSEEVSLHAARMISYVLQPENAYLKEGIVKRVTAKL